VNPLGRKIYQMHAPNGITVLQSTWNERPRSCTIDAIACSRVARSIRRSARADRKDYGYESVGRQMHDARSWDGPWLVMAALVLRFSVLGRTPSPVPILVSDQLDTLTEGVDIDLVVFVSESVAYVTRDLLPST